MDEQMTPENEQAPKPLKRRATFKDAKEILATVRGDEKYADLVLECRGVRFKVHRSIVCPQSSFFDAACSSGFKESHDGVINLPDDDPKCIERLVNFLYGSLYEIDSGSGSCIDAMLQHIKMYELGVKFDIEHLRQFSREAFASAARALDDTAPATRFLQLLQDVVDALADRDRAPLLQTLFAGKAPRELLRRAIATEEFREMCEHNGELAYVVLQERERALGRQLAEQKAVLEVQALVSRRAALATVGLGPGFSTVFKTDTKGTAVTCRELLGGCDGQRFAVDVRNIAGRNSDRTGYKWGWICTHCNATKWSPFSTS